MVKPEAGQQSIVGTSRILAVLSVISLVFWSGSAMAQSASEVVPGSFAPTGQRFTGTVVFSGERGTKAPPGSENLLITLAGLEIEGGLAEMADAHDATRNRLTGETITVAEIFNAASDLEAAYARSGFVLARVILPAQNLRDGGRMRIVVVDGFVESIDSQAAPEQVRDRINGLTDPLVGRRGLKLQELERRLLLAGDTYGIALGSALAAGATPGATTLILQPEFRPVTGFLAFDNSVSEELGPVVFSTGVELNSPLSLGETFYARLSGALSGDNANGVGAFLSDDPRLRTISLGAIVPLGLDGMTLNVEGTDSRSAPNTLTAPTVSRFQRQSVRLFYPFIRSRNRNISGRLTFDKQSDEQFLVVPPGRSPIYRDETAVLRFAADGFWLTENNAAIEAGAVLSQGMDAFGARTAAAAAATSIPLSRIGADAEFSKLVLSGRVRKEITEQFNLSLAGRAQTSFGDALVTGEQFGIAGGQEISAFDAGSLKGDSGWVARAEVSAPFQKSIQDLPLLISPYAFAAVGGVSLEQPTGTEQAQVNASAVGIGIEFNTLQKSNFSNGTMRIEYARGNRDDSQPDNDRFSILGSFRF